MELWDSDYLDMEVPAFLHFGDDGLGEFQFGLVCGQIDYRIAADPHHPRLEFSWSGVDEQDPVSGRGWAEIKGDRIKGRIYIHLGDDSSFVATKRQL